MTEQDPRLAAIWASLLQHIGDRDDLIAWLRTLDGGPALLARLDLSGGVREHWLRQTFDALKWDLSLVAAAERTLPQWSAWPPPGGPPPATPGEPRSALRAQSLSSGDLRLSDGAPALPAARKHNVPAPTERFVGREAELEAIHRLLGAGPGALGQRQGSLIGLGGVGKTQLALAYAWRHRDDYHHLCWVDAEGDGVLASFAGLADDPLGLALRTTGVPDRARAVKAALEQPTAQPHLLILDNVEGGEAWRQILPAANTRVLVTTRRVDLGLKAVRVEVLPEDEAIRLLLGESAAETDGARALCRRLGSLPLAVAVAGRWLEIGGRQPAELLDRLDRKGALSWSDRARTQGLFKQQPSLALLFDASVEQLDAADPVDAHARRLLWVGGWFAAAPIPRQTLLDAAARLAGPAVDPDDAGDAVARLLALGLIQVEEGQPVLHRLVAEYARARGGEAGDRAVRDALAALAANTGAGAMAIREIAPWAAHLAEVSSRLTGDSPEAHLRIALRLAQYYRQVARYADSLALCARLAPLLGEGEWAASFYNEGGQALQNLGKYDEALRFYTHDLVITERTLGRDHPETAVTLNAIGQVLQSQGKVEEALAFFTRDLAITERARGGQHPEMASTLHTIGQALHSQGKFDEARQLFERALLIREKVLGAAHPSTAFTLGALGRTHQSQGALDLALNYHMRALSIKEETLGREHPSTASTLHAIGQALHSQGKVHAALAFYERALRIKEDKLGSEHPSTASLRFDLGRCRLALGDLTGRAQMEQATAQLEALLGADHPDVRAQRASLD